jgi:hypothetical protein
MATENDEVLAQQLIDIGYKRLALRLHPDTGGSTEAMTRLTACGPCSSEASAAWPRG